MKNKTLLIGTIIFFGLTTQINASTMSEGEHVLSVKTSQYGDREIEEHVSVYYSSLLRTYYYNVIINGKKMHFALRGGKKTNEQIEQAYRDGIITPQDGHKS